MSQPPDTGFARLKALLIRRTGHHYYEDKDDLLWERVQRRLRDLGLPGSGAYLQRLADPVLGEHEWAALEAEITIGETFFFRYAEQFAALRTTILPELLERRRHSRRLRIWSAGCANGAEPYSIAILLRQLLGEALGQWNITLLGTDLSAAALARARAATFSAWSLRTVPSEERARDFLPGPGGLAWQLQPRHQQMVHFQRHNLMDLLAPAAATPETPDAGLRDFDLILCRNVLIYFHPDVVVEVVRGLAGRLAPGGWLLLGHAEPNPAFSGFLDPVSLPGTAAWRQAGDPLAPGTAAGVKDASIGMDATATPVASTLGAPARSATGPGRQPPAWMPLPLPPDFAAVQGTAGRMAPGAGFATPPANSWPMGDAAVQNSGTSGPAPSRRALPHFAPPNLSPTGRAGHEVAAGGSPSSPATAAGMALEQARRRADLGDLDGASAACREGLAAEPDHAPLHFYEAMIAGARGQVQAAEHAFRRAIALRQGFAMAHYQLGLLLLAAGQRQPGRQALAAAARIAHGLPDSALLEEGDGMTARDLREAARLQLEAPGGA